VFNNKQLRWRPIDKALKPETQKTQPVRGPNRQQTVNRSRGQWGLMKHMGHNEIIMTALRHRTWPMIDLP